MANNPKDRKLESYHEIPASHYIFLFNTAIHKRFFLYWTIISMATIWVSTRFINVDFLILSFLTVYWWVTPATIGILSVIGYAKYLSTRNKKKNTLLLCPFSENPILHCPYPFCIGAKCSYYPKMEVKTKQ